MKTYADFAEDISPYDDWGVDSENNNAITEAGLAKVIKQVKTDNKDFIIITSYRAEFSKRENIARNRQLRHWFNRQEMGVYQLVGHWRECSIKGVSYEKCPKDKLVDVIERSYLAIRPDDMESKDFFNKAKYLTRYWKQDGSVIRIQEMFGKEVRILEKDGSTFSVGTSTTLGKIAQAYSQHVKKLQVPFVFEGVEIPATNIGKQIAAKKNFIYPIGEWDDLRSWKVIVSD